MRQLLHHKKQPNIMGTINLETEKNVKVWGRQYSPYQSLFPSV